MKKGLKINRLLLIGGLLSGAFFAFSFFMKTPVQAAAGINQTINFQGRLLNVQGATVADGFYNIQFKIYQDGDGQSVGNTTGSPAGSLKWTENRLNANTQGVKVTNGYLSVNLGSVTAFGSSIDWNQDTLWLSMNIGGTGPSCTPFSSCSPDGEMIPMQRLTSAPYSLNSGRLGGLTSSQYVQLAQGLQTDTSNVDAISINKTGGSGNIIALQSGGNDVFLIGNTGDVTSKHNSTTAFQVQNAAGANLLTVDSITTSNLVTNGDIEGGTTTGWTAKGSTTVTQTTSHQWQGNSSLSVATTTAANDGAKYNYTFGATTKYTLSFYAKVASGSITDFVVGRQDVSGTDVNCLTGQTVTTNWTKFVCTFTTGGTISGSNIYVQKSSASAETFFIDGIQLQTGDFATAFNAGGAIQLGTLVNSPIAFQNKTDSTTSFQVQNAAGTDQFTIDSLNQRIAIGNVGGFSDSPVKLADPTGGLPPDTGHGTAFSPDGTYMSVAHDTSPYVTIYKRSGDTFAKLTDPTLPTGSASGVAFSPDGTYMSVAHTTTPFVTIYKINRTTDAFTALTNPATLPAGNGREVAFSPDGTYMSVAHTTTPFVTIYKRSGDTFTALVSPMDTLPTGQGNGVAFSPDGTYMSVAHSTALPLITIYKRSGDTFNKLADPATLPTGVGNGVAFSPDGTYMSVAHDSSPNVTIYKRSGDTFNKLADPATLPAGSSKGVAFSPDGTYMSVAHSTTPFVTIYKGVGGAVRKLEIASHADASGGLGFGKEIALYRSAPGVLSLATGGSLQIDGGNFKVQGNIISTGEVLHKNSINSLNAFQIQNATGTSILNIDTTNSLVSLGMTAFSAVTNSTCSANCTISQAYVDSYSTVIINSSTVGITMTLPDPTITSTNGRIIYLSTANGSTDFTLVANSGGSLIEIAMRQNVTASLVWNGTDWAAAGASNATTLQATYNNGTNPSTTPEIKLDSTHGTIDIQDADTTIGADLFNIRSSNAGNLGTVLLGVGNTGRVTIRNSTDQQAAFRFQNAGGNYLLNVNTASDYFINNSTKSPNNDLVNPGFEAGAESSGDTSTGEQGWFGSAQSVSVNDSSNAHTGNFELQVTPNGTNLDVYGGGYYTVQPGDTIYFEGWVKNSGGANGTGGIQLTFYDKDKASPTSSTNYATLPGTSYILKTITATVPAGKYYAKASAAVRSTATTGTYYFDDLTLRRSNFQAPFIMQNSENSVAAFKLQSAGASNTLLTADTSNNIIKVGDDTGTDTNTTVLVLDSATANPTTLTNKDGGLYYRSDNNSLKTILGGSVYDICTTAAVCSGYGAGSGSVISLQASSPGTQQTGHFNISGTGILTQLQTQDTSTGSTNSSNLTVRTGNATGATSNSGNLVLDVGTATGTMGNITIGHSGVATYIPGTLAVQSASGLTLGNASSATGSIRLYNSVGSNHITIAAAGSNPTSSWSLTLPQNPGSSGDCLKDSSGSGALTFGNCAAGVSVTLQDAYNSSSSPAQMTLANSKNVEFIAQETTTDPSVLINLQCTTCSASGGRFAVQNGGTDVLTVNPNSGGITLAVNTQIGSATTNGTQTNLQLDSFSTLADSGTCNATTNQGALYYNTVSLSIRTCQNSSWVDVITTKDMGLFMFGVVPDSGANPWDLPSKVTAGVSGPCKPSWASATTVNVNACIAYSGGRRLSVPTTTVTITGMNTSTTRYAHICLNSSGTPTLTTVGTSLLANMPSFSLTAPTLCLADVVGSTSTANNIDDLYDTRTFTTTVKTAVIASTAVANGMIIDVTTNGAIQPAVAGSQKLNGVAIVSDGSTSSTTPNVIIGVAGPSNVKCVGTCTAGDFLKTSSTNGLADTTTSIPNNSFYYSVGNARNAFSTTCSAASNCNSSSYVDFIVR